MTQFSPQRDNHLRLRSIKEINYAIAPLVRSKKSNIRQSSHRHEDTTERFGHGHKQLNWYLSRIKRGFELPLELQK